MNNKDIFSSNLHYHLHRINKTQKDLSIDLGYSTSTVSDWFNGKIYPRINTIQKLADYFGILKTDLIEERKLEDPYTIENIYNSLSVEDKNELLKYGRYLLSKNKK